MEKKIMINSRIKEYEASLANQSSIKRALDSTHPTVQRREINYRKGLVQKIVRLHTGTLSTDEQIWLDIQNQYESRISA